MSSFAIHARMFGNILQVALTFAAVTLFCANFVFKGNENDQGHQTSKTQGKRRTVARLT